MKKYFKIQNIIVIVLIFALIAEAKSLLAQTWARSYGNPGEVTTMRNVILLSDGGYITAGEHSNYLWISRLTKDGDIIWENKYGWYPSDYWILPAIKKTMDKNILIMGQSSNHSVYLAKIDIGGNILWQKKYKWQWITSDLDVQVYSLDTTPAGDIIIAGTITGYTYPWPEEWRLFVIKADGSGNLLWRKIYDVDYEGPWIVKCISVDSCVLAGAHYGTSGYKGFMMNIDSSGDIQWQKLYDGGIPYSMQIVPGGGLIIAGRSGFKGWIMKIDDTGIIEWQKLYGSTIEENIYHIEITSDGFIATGITNTFGAGQGDLWVLKLNSYGDIQWQKAYGGSLIEYGFEVKQAYDRGYIVLGHTESFGKGYIDGWILKLDAEGHIDSSCSFIEDTAVISSEAYVTSSDSAFGLYFIQFDLIVSEAIFVPEPANPIVLEQCYGCINDAQESNQNCYVSSATITGGQKKHNNFCNDADDWFVFNACGGRQYTIETLNLGTAADTVLELYGTDCTTLIASDDNGGGGLSSRIVWTAPLSGSYHVLAKQKDSTFGKDRDYDIQLIGDTSPCTLWARSYSGEQFRSANSLSQTSDGGFIVGGTANIIDLYNHDFWIVKLDAKGIIQWQKAYGSEFSDEIYSINEVSDGGFIAAGYTSSFNGGGNSWIVRLDNNGDVIWQVLYLLSPYSNIREIEEIPGEGFVFVVNSWDSRRWFVKIDYAGNVILLKELFSSFRYEAFNLEQTSDHGFVIAGIINKSGEEGLWLAKLYADGSLQWQKKYQPMDYDIYGHGIFLRQTDDDGYIIMGKTIYYGEDVIIIKLDEYGGIQWQKQYGGSFQDGTNAIQQTQDGGYIVSGFVNLGDYSYERLWIMKLDSKGLVQWSKIYQGEVSSRSFAVRQTTDRGYITAGYKGPSTDIDMWVLKLDSNGLIDSSCTLIEDFVPVISTPSITVSNADLSIADGQFQVFYTAVEPVLTSANMSEQCSWGYILLQPYLKQRPMVDDSSSPVSNGIIEPDELVMLKGHLQNIGTADAFNVIGLLTTTDPVTIVDPDGEYGSIASGEDIFCTNCYKIEAPLSNRQAPHWDFTVNETLSADNYGPINYDYMYHVGNSFSDVPIISTFYQHIEALLHYGIINGCSNSMYCPNAVVQREQMAKFLCKSMELSKPGSCIISGCNNIFTDVPASNIFCPYIEGIYNSGVVNGCQNNPLMFCPTYLTQRQTMAKFICNAMNVVNPNSCTTSECSGIFTDVDTANPFCIYIEALYNANIISGCGPSIYCPVNNVFRDQMAKFLVNAFGFIL